MICHLQTWYGNSESKQNAIHIIMWNRYTFVLVCKNEQHYNVSMTRFNWWFDLLEVLGYSPTREQTSTKSFLVFLWKMFSSSYISLLCPQYLLVSSSEHCFSNAHNRRNLNVLAWMILMTILHFLQSTFLTDIDRRVLIWVEKNLTRVSSRTF